MSEAITKALQDVIAAHDHSLAIMGEQMRDAGVTALTIGGPEGDAALKMFEAISAARAALSQPAPSPQPAVPVVSDEQVRKTVESIQDPDTVPAFHNGYYTLTPDELRRAILALLPAVEPMTLPPVEGDVLPAIGSKVLIHLASSDSWAEHEVVGYYVWEAINDLAKPRHHRVFVRVRDADGILNARHICDVRGITAKAEDAHQPTKEAEKAP